MEEFPRMLMRSTLSEALEIALYGRWPHQYRLRRQPSKEREEGHWWGIAIRVGGSYTLRSRPGAHLHRLFEVCKFSGVANVMEPWGARSALAGIGV